MPQPYETEVREITVGQATSTPRDAWQIYRFQPCDCPNCEEGEHWVGMLWFKTETQADAWVARYGTRGQ